MKKTTDKTMRLFLILLAIALAISVGIAHVSASMGYLSKTTVFRGHPEILGVQSDNPNIAIYDGDLRLGETADFASYENELPIIEGGDIRYDRGWINAGDGKNPLEVKTFQIAVENGEVVKNLRLHLDIQGNEQLASTVRCGIVMESTNVVAPHVGVISGFSPSENIDISTYLYSMDIPNIYAGCPLQVTTYLWVDKTALAEAGIYKNSDMEVSLVVY